MREGMSPMSQSPSENVAARVMDIIAKEGLADREKISRQATLQDLEIESVDMLMVLMGIEQAFDLYIPMDETTARLENVGDLIDLVEKMLAAKAGQTA